jgi:arabinan endo-1,5-alpha-L-arabinosidase
MQAPDVSKVGDYYYLYYSVSTFGSQTSAIGLARSSTMDYGTWTDLGSIGVTSSSSKSYNAIDPNLFEADGSYYLTFGSFWDDIFVVDMKSTPTAHSGSASQIAYTSDGQGEEGSYMFPYGDYYYLFYSKGQCCGYDTSKPASGLEYKIMVCRSTSPTSGFVDADGADCADGGGTLVLESHDTIYGPGGQGVYDDPTYGPIIYYHYGKRLPIDAKPSWSVLLLTPISCGDPRSGYDDWVRRRRQAVRLEHARLLDGLAGRWLRRR